jgi:hypothetical protein
VTNPSQRLVELIHEAIDGIAVNGVLPANAALLVLDPESRTWEHYATGGTAAWFATVVVEDAVTVIYRGARLVGSDGTTFFDYLW